MLLPLEHISRLRENTPVAFYQQRAVSQAQFSYSVSELAATLVNRPEQRWALYCSDALLFAVAFFALLHAGKDIVLPGNLTPATRASLQQYSDALLADIDDADIQPALLESSSNELLEKPFTSTVTIFTSGSTGEPKAIIKALSQFAEELKSLEQQFGAAVKDCHVVGTVSHQHIYGLLFRVLWPLASQRPFYSQQVLDNGLIHHAAMESGKPLIWVASPAHLKRLYEGLDWPAAAAKIARIFSSGGPLPKDAAEQVYRLIQHAPVEVFGSSETGGIAFRQQEHGNQIWQVLPGVAIQVDEEQRLSVRAKHINTDYSWYSTDDAALLKGDGRFELQGRLDRIVKLEEKRLSLVELEKAIIDTGLVTEVYCWVLPAAVGRIRQTLTATVVLNAQGAKALAEDTRATLIKTFKQQLQQRFELSLIPRKWRFVEQLPMNAQAKIDRLAIEKLMTDDTHS